GARVGPPRWDEPYCLAAAEALACGTPVAGFARGALPDLLDERCAVLTTPDDAGELAAGLRAAVRVSRSDARAQAVAHCAADRVGAQYQALHRAGGALAAT